jgi:hypothetical protein
MTTIKNMKVIGKSGLWIEFSDGKIKSIDLTILFNKGIFSQLADPGYFQLVRNNGYFIAWPNDQELSADTLYHF